MGHDLKSMLLLGPEFMNVHIYLVWIEVEDLQPF